VNLPGVPQHVIQRGRATIHAALNHELVLERRDFQDKIEAMTRRQARTGARGRPPGVDEGRGIYAFH